MPAENNPYVAIIDDDPELLEAFVLALTRAGLKARGFRDAQKALYSVIDDRPATIVVDLTMPGMDGLDFMRRLQVSAADVPVIMVTGADCRYAKIVATTMAEMGAVDFLRKPVEMRVLVDRVRNAVTMDGTRRAVGVSRKA